MRIGAIGDIHLDLESPRLTHTLEVWDWAIEDGLRRGVTHWVLAGDTHESDPSPDERLLLVKRIARMTTTAHGPYRPVGIVEGNHEGQRSLLDLHLLAPHITVASGKFPQWKEPAARVLFIPYPHRNREPYDNLDDDGTIAGSMRAAAQRIQEVVAYAVADRNREAPKAPILVFGHFTIESMTTRDTEFEVHRADEVIVPVTAFQGVQFVAVGHIHKQQEIDVKSVLLPHLRTGDIDTWLTRMTPQIIGLGGLVRHSRAEAEDPKSYTVIEADERGVTWERVPVPARGIVTRRVRVVDGQIPESELVAIAEESKGNELSLTVEMTEDQAGLVDIHALEARLGETAASVSIDRKTESIQRARAPELATEMTPEAELKAWLRATNQEVSPERMQSLEQKIAEVPHA